MTRRLQIVLPWVVAFGLLSLGVFAGEPTDDGFAPIFNGRTLDGWRGQDMSFWSVEDEAITGTITPQHVPPMNQYLVYQPELVENFELKLEFRLTGSTTPNTNGGFQFRSRRTPNGDVAGYQVDNNFGQPWKVRLYDEFGRHDLALEGERSRFDPAGMRHVEPLTLEAGARDFQLDQWHEYHLLANGQNLALRINGKLVAACTDDDPQQFEPAGVLAMQLHTGPPMKAQFRKLRMKKLPPTQTITPRERLFETAALDWTLGDRPASHQPPLAMHGDISTELASAGQGANSASTVAEFKNAWFDAGKDWNTPGAAITVYLRARAADGNWSQALFSKRGGHDRLNFNLFATDLSGEPGADIGFEIRTDQGFYQVSFPTSKIDATAWHDLVGCYDGKALAIYCDGKLMHETPASGNLVQNAEPLLIGAETDGSQIVRPFTGQMERAAVWSRALDKDELRLIADD